MDWYSFNSFPQQKKTVSICCLISVCQQIVCMKEKSRANRNSRTLPKPQKANLWIKLHMKKNHTALICTLVSNWSLKEIITLILQTNDSHKFKYWLPYFIFPGPLIVWNWLFPGTCMINMVLGLQDITRHFRLLCLPDHVIPLSSWSIKVSICCTKVCNLHLDDSFSKSRDNRMHWTRCNLLKWKGIYKNYEPFTDQLQPIYFTCNDL